MSLLLSALDGDVIMDDNWDIKIVVPGIAVNKKNNMLAARGRVIKNKRVKNFEALVRTFAAVAMAEKRLAPFKHPLAIQVTAFYPDRKRRDVQNIPDVLFDAMESVVYENDCQVVDVILSKRLCAKGDERTEIKIWELADDERFPLVQKKYE